MIRLTKTAIYAHRDQKQSDPSAKSTMTSPTLGVKFFGSKDPKNLKVFTQFCTSKKISIPCLCVTLFIIWKTSCKEEKRNSQQENSVSYG